MTALAARPLKSLQHPAVQANRLLAALPKDVLERLLPHIEKVTLFAGDTLYNAGGDVDHLYFPSSTVVILLLQLGDGAATKVAVIGREGVVGISVFMGGATALGRAVVLNTGDAFKISAAVLKTEFDRNGAAMRLLLRFTQVVVTQMAQTALCNRHHLIEQQLCTWLLTCMDRLPQGSALPVTHETMAGMLGVRREGITDAATTLRELGLIANSRGQVRILDRTGLQARACECYQVVKRETDRLLPDRQAI